MTAEFALAVPAVALVLAFSLAGLQLGTQQLLVQDAATTAARSGARGAAVDIRSLIAGATATTETRDGLLCVRVAAPAATPVPLLSSLVLTASSCSLAGG